MTNLLEYPHFDPEVGSTPLLKLLPCKYIFVDDAFDLAPVVVVDVVGVVVCSGLLLDDLIRSR